MYKQLLAAFVGVMALAALAVGCGGGSSTAADTSTTEAISTSSLTKSQFVKKANAICLHGRKDWYEEVVAYLGAHEKDKGKNEAELLAEAIQKNVLPSMETQIKEIRDLGAPRGDASQIEKFLLTLQRLVDVAKERPEFSSRFPFDRLLHPAGELARGYGIDYCGYGEGPRN